MSRIAAVAVRPSFIWLPLAFLLALAGIWFTAAGVFGQGSFPQIRQISDTTAGQAPVVDSPIFVSQDGSLVAFVVHENLSSFSDIRLYVGSTDATTPPRPITPPGLNVRSFFNIVPPPFGSKIAFFACDNLPCGTSNLLIPGDVYVVGVDGLELPTRLTFDGPTTEGASVWYEDAIVSGDGGTVAFTQQQPSPTNPNPPKIEHLFFIDSDGANRREIVLPSIAFNGIVEWFWPLSFSADGTELAFVYGDFISSREVVPRIGAIRTDGTGFRKLLDPLQGSIPALSGDWTTLVFSGSNGLSVMNTDGTGVPVLDTTPTANASITFDGSEICYAGLVGFQHTDILCINADGTNRRNITNTPVGGDAFGNFLGANNPSISSNGSVVAFLSNADLDAGKNTDLNQEVFAANLRPIIQITNTSLGIPPFLDFNDGPTISGDGSLVAFVLDSEGEAADERLYVGRTDGTQLLQVSGSALSVRAQHLPTTFGNKIAFVACPSGFICHGSNAGFPGDVYIVGTDGTALTRLTVDGSLVNFGTPNYLWPVVSADGTTVAFTIVDGFLFDKVRLVIINADGTARRELVLPVSASPFTLRPLSFSPDGSQLAFAYGEFQIGKIAVVNTDGTGFRILVDPLQSFPFALSGDWTTIAYVGDASTIGLPMVGLFVGKTDGTPPILLDTAAYCCSPPSISYDGSRVAYSRLVGSLGSVLDVFHINSDGTNARSVANTPEGVDASGVPLFSLHPAISQDGSAVAFNSNADLDAGKNTDLSFEVFVALGGPPPPTPAPAPTVTDIVPGAGPVTGGTSVTITGTGFVGGLTVSFGTGQAAVVEVQPGTIQVLTPAQPAGLVDVVVTNPDGQSSPPVSFTYFVPLPTPPTGIGAAGGTTNPQQAVSEPVSTGNGNYYYQHTDFIIPGRGLPLAFQRTYNALDTYSGPLGAHWTHTYNVSLAANPAMAVIKWDDGHGETFSFNGTMYVPQPGVFSTLTKQPDNTFVLLRKNQTRYMFSAAGQLAGIADRNGNLVTLTYDDTGNLQEVTDAGGRRLTLTHDANNRIVQVTDPLNRAVSFSYSAANDLVAATDPAGGQTSFAYDAQHRVRSITLPDSQLLLENTYDAQGRVLAQRNGRGLTTSFVYGSPNSGDTTIIDPRGNRTVHTYDAALRVVGNTDAFGGQTSYTYDTNNNRPSVTNASGHTTQFTYDGQGNLTGILDALNQTASFTYDAQNNLLTATNPRGFVTTFTYDGRGNLTQIRDTLANVTSFEYSGVGELIAKTDARNNITRFDYDQAGNLIGITDALGNETTLAYDTIGRLSSVTDPNTRTATAAYDLLSRLLRVTDPLGNHTRFSYDAIGNLLEITDPNGNATQYSYDVVNNLAHVTDAAGNVTSYEYDETNNRVGFTNANTRMTVYTYDALNRLTSTNDPLNHLTTYDYDLLGNVQRVTDAKGQVTVFSYDVLNRLVELVYGDGQRVAYTYDANSNRTAMLDATGTTIYSYDAVDRLLSVTHPSNRIVRYAYDSTGNRLSLTSPDGKTMAYNYDQANRLTAATDWLGRRTAYNYDPVSNLLGLTYPNQASITFGYDAANRLVQVGNSYRGTVDGKTTPLSTFTYSLDSVGNRLQVIDGNGQTTAYGYDALYQLTQVTSGDKLTRFTYDPVGNRLSVTAPSTSIIYQYDMADRLLSAGDTRFTYDANGNQITRTKGRKTDAFTYDAGNRLTRVTDGRVVSRFSYDGDGNRVTQSVGTGTYAYINDVASALPVVLQEAGPDGAISYAYGLGLISGSSQTFDHFYHYDGLGSAVGLTDPAGKLLGRYTYDAWGQPILTTSDDVVGTKNKFRFTGEALDPGTGLYYLRARYYDPTIGRFVSKDPFPGSALMPNSLNRYAYVLNNPATLVDPFGLFSLRPLLGEFAELAETFALKVGTDIVVGAGRGATHAYRTFQDIGVIIPGATGGISGRVGGWNIVGSVRGALKDYIADKVLDFVFSNGGRTEVRDTPWLSRLPFGVGLFFSGVPAAGEVIDSQGNVYDSLGRLIDRLPQAAPFMRQNAPDTGSIKK